MNTDLDELIRSRTKVDLVSLVILPGTDISTMLGKVGSITRTGSKVVVAYSDAPGMVGNVVLNPTGTTGTRLSNWLRSIGGWALTENGETRGRRQVGVRNGKPVVAVVHTLTFERTRGGLSVPPVVVAGHNGEKTLWREVHDGRGAALR